MGDINPWVLGAFANEAVAHDRFNGSANRTAPVAGPNAEESPLGAAWFVLKGLLPMLTLMFGGVGQYLLDYVLYNILSTLASVETPVPGGVDSEKIGSGKYGILSSAESGKAAIDVKPHYVTDSIRATLRHVHAEAGDLSMFRGIGANVTMFCILIPSAFALNVIVSRFVSPTHTHIHGLLIEIIGQLFMARAGAALTHIVISKPRNKFWFRRLPLSWFGVVRKVSVAVIAQLVAHEAIEGAFGWAFSHKATRQHPGDHGTPAHVYHLSEGPIVPLSMTLLFMILAKGLVRAQIKPLVKILLTTPFDAIKDRIQASMLPDDDDPIVPMDRSFQGRPQSGGVLQQPQEPLSFVQAGKTIDKKTYIRLVKMYIKLHLIKQVAIFAFWTFLFGQVVILVGPSAIWVVLKMVLGTNVTQHDLDAVTGDTARGIFEKMITAPVKNSTGLGSALDQDLPLTLDFDG